MDALSFHISINALRHSSEGWGDLAYAKSLAAALESKRHKATLFFREEKPDLTSPRDVVIRIIGPHLDEPVEGVVNLLWMISPPNLAPPRSLGRYQGLFVAAQHQCTSYAAQFEALGLHAPPPDLARPAPLPKPQFLAQATDLNLFNPGRASAEFGPLDLVFVGNHAPRAPRSHVLNAIALGFEPALWGQGWYGVVPQHLIRGKRVSAEQLASIYASAEVVLNSHMPMMARQGFMSNRSFDALACGAAVVSDWVEGFAEAALPGLHLVAPQDDLAQVLRRALDAPPPSPALRRQRHEIIRAGYSFAARADVFVAAARAALASASVAPAAFQPCRFIGAKPSYVEGVWEDDGDVSALGDHAKKAQSSAPDAPIPSRDAAGRGVPDDGSPKLSLRLAAAPERALPGDADPAQLCALAQSHAVALTVELTDPALSLSEDARAELLRSARMVARICRVLEVQSRLASLTVLPVDPPAAAQAEASLIHAGQADLRAAQALLSAPNPALAEVLAPALAARARRLLEAAETEAPSAEDRFALRRLLRVQRAAPLYEHSPADFDRDRQKRHIVLWPRQQPPPARRPIGVFVHLYYDDLAPQIRDALCHLELPFQLYVSTDSAAKATRLARVFAGAEIRVLPNRGRDIWPKLYGFADRYAAHDLVLHLHSKRSNHAASLDGWLAHILDCLLPESSLLRRLLSFFDSVPKLGIVAPTVYRPTLASGHWGDNFEIARELAARMRLKAPLPGNDRLVFPAGSMFWARPEALRPLLDLKLAASAFPPEIGQIDGTPAHAIERLYGPVCREQGFEMISVAPPSFKDWPGHALKLRRNAELKAELNAGSFYNPSAPRLYVKDDPQH